jgi:hypothetical protein
MSMTRVFKDSRFQVRVLGFEPRTSALSELRSSQLSYTRVADQTIRRHQQKSQTVPVWLPYENHFSKRATPLLEQRLGYQFGLLSYVS